MAATTTPGIMLRSLLALLLLPLLALGGCGGPSLDQFGSNCRVDETAQLPLTVAGNFLLAPTTIDGAEALMVVDTGAETTLVTPETVARLKLRPDASRTILLGVSGAMTSENVGVPEFGVGELVVRGKSVGVGTIGNVPGVDRPIAGLLGADILSRHDVEIDVPNRRMTLSDVRDCTGFVPWDGRAIAVPAKATANGLFYVPVAIDGHGVRGQLDTGARSSVLMRRVANRIGVTDAMLARDQRRIAHGIGTSGIEFWRHRFASVAVGGIASRDVLINVGDMRLPGVEMLLGADWIAGRRIWISYARGALFVYDGAG